MRRTTLYLTGCAAFGAIGAGAALAWRQDRRLGTNVVNSLVNPILLRRGLAGSGRSEIGTLEHVGRKSGIRRLTPVHPEPIAGGFRIIVPLGDRSEWARNVLAAGHCRLQLHDMVYELDEPTMISPAEAADLPRPVMAAIRGLGFEYLRLRTFAVAPGVLEPTVVAGAPVSSQPSNASIEALTSPIGTAETPPMEQTIAG